MLDTMPVTPTTQRKHAGGPGLGKIDVAKALQLRVSNKLSYTDIGKHFGTSKQAARKALKNFSELLPHPEILQSFENNQPEILQGVKFKLISKMVDSDKIEKASINNLAYSVKQLDDIIRLERNQATANIAYADYGKSLGALLSQRKALESELGLDVSDANYTVEPQDTGIDTSDAVGDYATSE